MKAKYYKAVKRRSRWLKLCIDISTLWFVHSFHLHWQVKWFSSRQISVELHNIRIICDMYFNCTTNSHSTLRDILLSLNNSKWSPLYSSKWSHLNSSKWSIPFVSNLWYQTSHSGFLLYYNTLFSLVQYTKVFKPTMTRLTQVMINFI